MRELRPYQIKAKEDIYGVWANDPKANVLLVLPTGSGKTVTFTSIVADLHRSYPTAIMVHRKELVQQIALTLADFGIEHNIIAPLATIRAIITAQRALYKRPFYNYKSSVTVLSVDTLNARILQHQEWARNIRFWICDEAAHVLQGNKWGQAIKYFPNAFGLGVTATPKRLDRRGLGRHADGVFDYMVLGPSTRWLIENQYLSRYKVAIPDSTYRQYLKDSKDDADYTKQAMLQAAEKSHIVGDVVVNYQKFANGLQAIVFADSIQTGQKLEQKFNSVGIAAKLLTSNNTDEERFKYLQLYKKKEIKVLINVDLFDEGLDVPGIECVSMARPSKSLGKVLQMIGRGLRLAEGKPHLILIDHVGNLDEHGLPDSFRRWTLDRISKRRGQGQSLVRFCSNITCNRPIDRVLTECPYCQTPVPKPNVSEGGGRPGIKQVDGDLILLDPDQIREIEADILLEDPAKVAERVSAAAGGAAGLSAMKAQRERIETQKRLADTIAQWAGVLRSNNYSDRMIMKQFFLDFDISIHEILAQPRADMERMIERIQDEL